jgi:hypothetical protein
MRCAVLSAMDEKAVEVEVGPIESDLECVVEVGDC